MEQAAQNNLPPARFDYDIVDVHDDRGKKIDTKEVEMIEVFIDAKTSPRFQVTDEHRRKWHVQYAAFKAGHEVQGEGTPLANWPAITKKQLENANMVGLGTVEELAKSADSTMQNFMGGIGLKQKAIAWVEAKQGVDASGALLESLEKTKLDNEAMSLELKQSKDAQQQQAAELAALQKQVAALVGKSDSSPKSEKASGKGKK